MYSTGLGKLESLATRASVACWGQLVFVVLFHVEPIGVVLVLPRLDAKRVLLAALIRHGKHLLAHVVAHELGELLDADLRVIDRLHKDGVHHFGCNEAC